MSVENTPDTDKGNTNQNIVVRTTFLKLVVLDGVRQVQEDLSQVVDMIDVHRVLEDLCVSTPLLFCKST